MNTNRLLVVDDQPAVAEVVAMIAAGCGYEVQIETDGAVALDRIAAWRPTHLLLDLEMPVVDGVQLMSALGTQPVALRIILSSGIDPKIVESARRLGVARGLDVADTLVKPFRANELRQILQRLRIAEVGIDRAELLAAMEDGGLFLEFQPKIDLHNGAVVAYEALARLRDSRLGVVMPDRFVSLAEMVGLTGRLTDTVVGLALGQMAAWGSDMDGALAINLCAGDLRDLDLADRIAARCGDAGIPPDRLILELTETSTVADPLYSIEILTRLRLKGFRLSLDDFGTGYSSLLQLARLPFSELKIDKTFVAKAHASPQSRAIVKSTIDLAHNMGLRAVAEGVEDAEALRLVSDLGCDQAQGYHIARPMPAEQVLDWQLEWGGRRKRAAAATDAVDHGAEARAIWSPWAKTYDGSEELRVALTQVLCERINPLWDLGRNSLVAWRPADGGIEVLLVPYQNIVDRFGESQRLLRGRRLMGDATFALAQRLAGARPAAIALPFRIASEDAGGVPADVIEQVLRRYGITETRHRAVALFDIVGFSRIEPRQQVAQLNSLECSINAAQQTFTQIGKAIDLARTTTGDGFYIWNRDKGPDSDLDTYLLTMLVLAENAMARRERRGDLVPRLRTCFSVGSHYSYYQVDGLDPRGHDYIVGDVTIGLARMASKCLADQVLIGDFERPSEGDGDPKSPLEFVERAVAAFARFSDVNLRGHAIEGIRCYLTGERLGSASFDASRFKIVDKHGIEHIVFNQKFNIYLKGGDRPVEPLFLGRQQADLREFDAHLTGLRVA